LIITASWVSLELLLLLPKWLSFEELAVPDLAAACCLEEALSLLLRLSMVITLRSGTLLSHDLLLLLPDSLSLAKLFLPALRDFVVEVVQRPWW
jgi:hypothetical protein